MPRAMPRQVSSFSGALSRFILGTLPAIARKGNGAGNQKRSGELDKSLFPAIGGESQPLIQRKSPGVIQGAGVDGQAPDGLQPGVDAGMVEEEIAQPLADGLRHQAEIGDIGVAGLAQRDRQKRSSC